jgi:general stress protein YciG
MKKKSALSKHLSRLGKRGGKARMESLSAKERHDLASEAGKKSGEARRKKAQHGG